MKSLNVALIATLTLGGLVFPNTIHASATRAGQQPAAAAPDSIPAITPEVEADLLSAHQHYYEAISAYLKIKPLTPALYNKIGLAYEHLGRIDEAKFNYQIAIRLDKKLAPAYNNLGTVYFHQKDNKQAERLYRKAIHLNNDNAAFWGNLGGLYLADRRYSDGAEAYERAFSIDSNIFHEIDLNGILNDAEVDQAKLNLCFAEIYAQAGMKTEALEYLRKAFQFGYRDKESLQQDQRFASLRGDPQFQQLVAQPHQK